jgi:cytochrome c peroxidase
MQRLGKVAFIRNCFSCHNTPNVFNNLSNVEPLGNGNRPDNLVPWGPMVGRAFNIGVSERNAHNLRFTRFAGLDASENPTYEPIVIPLANEDGSINNHVIQTDLGLALTTARTEDIGRFKVPQLRDLIHNAPYFHDNSAATIEEVVEYFNSAQYNNSKDGKRYPIHLSPLERAALIQFLKIL